MEQWLGKVGGGSAQFRKKSSPGHPSPVCLLWGWDQRPANEKMLDLCYSLMKFFSLQTS